MCKSEFSFFIGERNKGGTVKPMNVLKVSQPYMKDSRKSAKALTPFVTLIWFQFEVENGLKSKKEVGCRQNA